MNITKIFFTLVLTFSFAIVSQAQVDNTTPDNENTTIVANTKVVKINQVEENIALETNTSNTNVPAKSNTINITTNTTETKTEQTETIVFSFNHKQFLKPVFKKSALC